MSKCIVWWEYSDVDRGHGNTRSGQRCCAVKRRLRIARHAWVELPFISGLGMDRSCNWMRISDTASMLLNLELNFSHNSATYQSAIIQSDTTKAVLNIEDGIFVQNNGGQGTCIGVASKVYSDEMGNNIWAWRQEKSQSIDVSS